LLPPTEGLVKKIKSISSRIFDFSGLGDGSLPYEQISALGAAADLFVAAAWELKLNSASTQGLLLAIVFISYTAEIPLHHQK
jgi:hypothetical protein